MALGRQETKQYIGEDRPPVQRHIAFGQGVHACIGNSLARMEARQAVRAIARHADHISVTAGPNLRYLPSIIVRGLVELPVRVTRRLTLFTWPR